MGRAFAATEFPSAGNMTHTPTYGNLIALGVLYAAQQRDVSETQIANAARYRETRCRERSVPDIFVRQRDDRLPHAAGSVDARRAYAS